MLSEDSLSKRGRGQRCGAPHNAPLPDCAGAGIHSSARRTCVQAISTHPLLLVLPTRSSMSGTQT
jgi:hypothetical protein